MSFNGNRSPVKKFSIQSLLQTLDRCVVLMIMDVANNVVWEGFLKDTKIVVAELYDNKKSELLKNIPQGTENSYIYS